MPEGTGIEFGTQTLMEPAKVAPKQSNIALVGNSRKLTLVYYATPFVAAVAFLFGYFKLDMEYAKLFFDWVTVGTGGYLGGQSLIDTAGKVAELLVNRAATKNQPGQPPQE